MPLVKIRGSESSPKPDANAFVMHLDYLLALLSQKDYQRRFFAKAFDKVSKYILNSYGIFMNDRYIALVSYLLGQQ